MLSVAGFDANQTRFEFCEELQHFTSAKLSLNDHFPVAINAVNLKHVFCDI